MRVPLDVPPASLMYVYLKTVSRHFGAETKTTGDSLFDIFDSLDR